jgi:uncharacterized iron-regulated protein
VISRPPCTAPSRDTPLDTRRRRFATAVLGCITLPGLGACAVAPPPSQPWETRLQGDTVALLGEVHDNAEHHRVRTAVLRRAFDSGWRPAVVMEQFDIDRQADIERSRSERPRDASHLIVRAGATRGWDWANYEPLIQLVLQFDLPLLAGNLPRATAARFARESHAAVLGAERTRELQLDRMPDATWQAAQERQIDVGHCGALPRSALAGMARAQIARDAVMARFLIEHAPRGAVLLAGTGHVRRDIGVPRWLTALRAQTVLAVGFIEADSEPPAPGVFDAVVSAAPAKRADPCEAFKARPVRTGHSTKD